MSATPPDPSDLSDLSDRAPTAAEPIVLELAQQAIDLARGAARFVGEHHASAGQVSAKTSSTDLVTEVDRAAERWLREHILAQRPDDAILGEEAGGRSGTSGVRWLLDPIDGTVNFVLGIPQYAVSVAAELDGHVVAGAVCNPVSGETYHARRGGGAYRDDTRLRGPRAVPLSRAVVGTGFGYDAAMRARQVAVVAELLPQIADIRRMGAASLDLCAVAAGERDAYFEAGLNLWDYAAGALIATEAGAAVSGLRGRAPSGQMTAAAGPALAPEFFATLEALGADRVSS